MKDVWFVVSLYGSMDGESKEEVEEAIREYFGEGFKRMLLDKGIRIGDVNVETVHIGEYDEAGNLR